uniref:Complex 1 LYR protein domain-containing protein n=1 Tax=Octopus bimaculoides TaxID=37653 RepID=A0A0L8FQG7_OCTBM
MVHSKLQLEVLSLYRQLLRATRNKPGFKSYICDEFRRNMTIPRTNILQIEHIIRNGKKKLDLLKRQEVQSLGVFYKETDNLNTPAATSTTTTTTTTSGPQGRH